MEKGRFLFLLRYYEVSNPLYSNSSAIISFWVLVLNKLQRKQILYICTYGISVFLLIQWFFS